MQPASRQRSAGSRLLVDLVHHALHRYKALLLRRWWIPVLTICLGLFVQAWLIYQTPPSFHSASKMMLAGKLNISQGAVYSEDSVNFYGTQIQLMQSAEVRRSAEALVRSTHPEMQPVPVEITVLQKPRTSIFELNAIGRTPDYTQAYLNAVMQKYLDFKKGMREDQGHNVTTGDHRAVDPDRKRFAQQRRRDARVPESKTTSALSRKKGTAPPLISLG